MSFHGVKFLHLAGLVLWLGPSAGGYFLMMTARLRGDDTAWLWLLREYLSLVYMEAGGLLVLVLSGAVMLAKRPAYRKAAWLKIKLVIVFAAFVPLEAAALLIYRLRVYPAVKAGAPLDEAILLFDRFSLVAGAVLALAVPAVMCLAVFKPWARKDGAPPSP